MKQIRKQKKKKGKEEIKMKKGLGEPPRPKSEKEPVAQHTSFPNRFLISL
jgi:hypothetical protein